MKETWFEKLKEFVYAFSNRNNYMNASRMEYARMHMTPYCRARYFA